MPDRYKLISYIHNMITFGFRNKMSGVLRAVAAIVLGIVMIVLPDSSLRLLVQILAAVLIASGLVSVAYGIAYRRNGGLGLMVFNSVVDILLGILMFCYPDFVAGFIMVLLGVVLFLMGLMIIFTLVSAVSFVSMGFWAFLFPAVCTLGGALLIFSEPLGMASVVTVVGGIILLVYGVSELIASWKMRKAMQEYEIRFSPDAARSSESSDASRKGAFDDAIDVQYEKVDDDKDKKDGKRR